MKLNGELASGGIILRSELIRLGDGDPGYIIPHKISKEFLEIAEKLLGQQRIKT